MSITNRERENAAKRQLWRATSRKRTVVRVAVALLSMSALITTGNLGAASADQRSTASGAHGRSNERHRQTGASLPRLSTADGRIVDSFGRQVVLRGANLNSLGSYWKGGVWPATLPVTDADWAEMAAWGFNVVRLLVTWDRIEPQPGVYDEDYLNEVDAQVSAAAAHGIYTVLDMHQDAYTSYVHWDGSEQCASGTSPAKGWDGAPEWATITDGMSTCTPGERNATPAVRRAWQNFYDNRNGIADRFVAMWGHVAARFGGRTEIAGFDLLNEPETAGPSTEMGPKYNRLIANVIGAIRSSEGSVSNEHLLFVEPALPAGNSADGLVIPDPVAFAVDTRNVVAAPHNYAESIGLGGLSVTVEQLNDLFASVADGLGIPTWIGEYGYWDTSDKSLDAARRQAADDDRRVWGGAWWQWRQSCGDPHAVYWDSDSSSFLAPTSGESTHLLRLDCSTNEAIGPTVEFKRIAGRTFPRFAPGTVSELFNDFDSGASRVVGMATAASLSAGTSRTIEVWIPADSNGAVNVENLTDVVVDDVEGGRVMRAKVVVAGCYAIHIGEMSTSCPSVELSTTTTNLPTTTTAVSNSVAPSTVAAPVAAAPRFTG